MPEPHDRQGLESALSGKQDACAFSLDELLRKVQTFRGWASLQGGSVIFV